MEERNGRSIKGKVQFFKSDFDYKQWCRECLASNDEINSDLPTEIDIEPWDSFFDSNKGECYKDRNYIYAVFQSHFATNGEARSDPLTIWEIGCGHGSTAIPLITQLLENGQTNTHYIGSDISPIAVDRFIGNAASSHTFSVEGLVWNVALPEPCPKTTPTSVDICLSVFCLSALNPDQHSVAMRHLRDLLRPGGKVLLRDYAEHDMTMHKKSEQQGKIGPRLYRRKDRTLCYYFTQDYLQSLATGAGLQVVENEVHCVLSTNRRTQVSTKRCFVNVVLQKPHTAVADFDYVSAQVRLEVGKCSIGAILQPMVLSSAKRMPTVSDVAHMAIVGLACSGQSRNLLLPPPSQVVLCGKVPRTDRLVSSFLDSDRGPVMRGDVVALEISKGCKDGLDILTSGAFPSLRLLDVNSNRGSPTPLALFLSPHPKVPLGPSFLFPRLLSLNLSWTTIDRNHCSGLITYITSAALLELSVRGCSLCTTVGQPLFIALVRAATQSTVETLDLSEESRMSDDACEQLVGALSATRSLKNVLLDGIPSFALAGAARALGLAVSSSSITGLSLAGCKISDDALRSLVDGLSAPEGRRKLLSLVLNHNPFICSAPLHDLLSGKCTVDDAPTAQRNRNTASLRLLCLKGCRLSREAQWLLAGRIATSTQLLHLDLENNALCPEFMLVLCCRWRILLETKSKFQPCPSLASLALSNNPIGCIAVQRLFSFLSSFPLDCPLKCIFLRQCLPGPAGLDSIESFLALNHSLQYLEMRHDDFEGREAILALSGGPSNASRSIGFTPIPLRYRLSFISVLRLKKVRLDSDSIRHIFSFLVLPVHFRLVLV